jgi:hypothetical protein
MEFIGNIFNKKSKKIINDYKNRVPEDVPYNNTYIEPIKSALAKNNVSTVELFTTFESKELYNKVKRTNSSMDLILFCKGKIDEVREPYVTVHHSKREKYSIIILQHQFMYEELFGVELWADNNSTPEKIHAFNCYMSEQINNYCSNNIEIMVIGVGMINKKQYENVMEEYHKSINILNTKSKSGKAAIYTGIATTIGAGVIVGLKILSKRNKR